MHENLEPESRGAGRGYELQPPRAQNMREVYLRAIEELAKPFPSIPLPAWPRLNAMTKGLRLREYTILCGSTGSGKTTFLANLSAQLLRQGVRHFVMSIENGETDFMKRVISVLEGRDLNTGDAVPAGELRRIHDRHAELLERDTIELSLYDDRVHVQQLMHDIEHMVSLRGCQVAMIDNLNYLLQPTRSADAIFEMDRVTHDLVVFSKRTPVHLIMVMHPRKTDDQCRVATENDIKGSSTANQEAYNVLLWNRPRREDVEDGKRAIYDRELTIRKMRRNGAAALRTVVFSSEGTRYVEKAVT